MLGHFEGIYVEPMLVHLEATLGHVAAVLG